MAAIASEAMIHEVNVTEARKLISLLFDEAVKGERPVVIVRDGKEEGLLIARELVRRLVASYQLHVNITPHEDGKGFTLWVPELKVVADGASARKARENLLSAIRAYIRDYFEQFDYYRHFTDKLEQQPYVLRLSLARDDGELLEMLFGRKPAREPSSAVA